MAGLFNFGLAPLPGLQPVFDAAAEARKKMMIKAGLFVALAVVLFIIFKKKRGG